MMDARELLAEPCTNSYHAVAGGYVFPFDQLEHNPECSSCRTREFLATHDHLFCGNDAKCMTPGLTGVPGSMVKCKCGAYHH